MVQLARVGGGIATLMNMFFRYKNYRDAGQDQSTAGTLTILGYHNDPGGDNSFEKVTGRLIGTYWPAIGGEVIHQTMGNPKGAFGTGIGMKLNRHTPKGMNL